MGIPFSGPITLGGGCCEVIPGTQPPSLAPYVRSLNGLQGIITMEGDEYIDISSIGNTIHFDFDFSILIPLIISNEDGFGIDLENDNPLSAENGITIGSGSMVTSVGITSDTLEVTNSPITSSGDIVVNLSGATASIQELSTAADQMIYTTASDVYAATPLTPFARTVLDDTTAAAARTTLGAQTQSTDLDTFVTNATWTSNNLELAGDLEVQSFTCLGASIESITVENISVSDSVTIANDLTVTDDVTAQSFTGVGTGLTALNGSNITSGAVPAANGGTGQAGGYAIGDMLYASASGTLSKLADVAAGSFLRSGGVVTAPVWSATTWPNTLAVGDVLYASTTTAVSRLADVATGNALISGGINTAPAWGKITAAHTTGLANAANNTNITAFTGNKVGFNDGATFNNDLEINSTLTDASASVGTAGQILTSLAGSGVQWESDIDVATVTATTVTADEVVADTATFAELILLTPVALSALPTTSGYEGAIAMINDADTPLNGSPVVGSGSQTCPVWFNGTDWIAFGV